MNELETKRLVAAMVAACPASRVDEQSTAVYERLLGDLDASAANAAVAQILATTSSPFLPSVGAIRERAIALQHGEVRAGGEAWGSVLKAIGRWGYMRTPGVDFQFDDPVTLECVHAMNWRELCESENAVADRARFIELYDQLAIKHRRSQLSDGLPAVQRFRALQEARREQAGLGGSQPIGALLQFVMPVGEGES